MTVKVYSAPTCRWCTIVKEYLSSKNIDYVDIDVSKDREASLDIVHRSGQRSVPVVEINGNIVVGFDQEKIDSLLSE